MGMDVHKSRREILIPAVYDICRRIVFDRTDLTDTAVLYGYISTKPRGGRTVNDADVFKNYVVHGSVLFSVEIYTYIIISCKKNAKEKRLFLAVLFYVD